MKTITRLLLLAAISIGMVACSNDDVPQAPESAKGNTYASISIKLPKGPSTRALPEDYNDKGTWDGIDAISSITVFLVNETVGTIDHSTFGTNQFKAIDNGVLKPELAVKGTPGQSVKAYVVLNGNTTILGTLKEAKTPAAFETAYEKAVAEIASNLASNDGKNDVIMMTNTVKPTAIEIKPNVKEDEAKTGSVNRIEVEVERVVSRAITTVKAGPHTIAVLNYLGEAGTGSTITVQSLSYVVGQSNKKFFLTKKTDWTTPADVYGHVPSVDTWNPELFDNTGLEKSIEIKDATGAAAIADFNTALTTELANSKFVLPVTHEDKKYEKGNTTYFEVTAIFTPDKVDGKETYAAGADVFLGMRDGKFYSTRKSAEAENQQATMYKGTGTTATTKGAIMKYVLWLNPDKVPGATTADKATMSPTVRNQVYHAHINSFKKIGLPNNPLNPTELDEFGDNPGNPIRPEDPLQTEDTYLSVQITVLPWGMHSYQIDLGNDY